MNQYWSILCGKVVDHRVCWWKSRPLKTHYVIIVVDKRAGVIVLLEMALTVFSKPNKAAVAALPGSLNDPGAALQSFDGVFRGIARSHQ